jgi:hypothetical protein
VSAFVSPAVSARLVARFAGERGGSP